MGVGPGDINPVRGGVVDAAADVESGVESGVESDVGSTAGSGDGPGDMIEGRAVGPDDAGTEGPGDSRSSSVDASTSLLKGDANGFLQRLQCAQFLGRDQGQRVPRGFRAAGATNAVDIRFG